MKSSPCFFCLLAEKVLQAKSAKSAESLFPFLFHSFAGVVTNFVTTRVYAIKSSFVLLSRKIVLPLSTKFRRHSGGMRKDFIEKGVIEIIFISEILAKFHLE